MNRQEITSILSNKDNRAVLLRVVTENYRAGLVAGRGINCATASYEYSATLVEMVTCALGWAMIAPGSWVNGGEMNQHMKQDTIIASAVASAQAASNGDAMACYMDALSRIAKANEDADLPYPRILLDLAMDLAN